MIFPSPVTIPNMPGLQSSPLSVVFSALCSPCFFGPFFLDILYPLIPLKMTLLWAGNWTSDLLSTKIFQWSCGYLIITTSFAFLLKLFQVFYSIKIFKFFIIIYESPPKWIYLSLTLYSDLCLPAPCYDLCTLSSCALCPCFHLYHFLVNIPHKLYSRTSPTKP